MAAEVKREDCEMAVKNYLKTSKFNLEDCKVKPLSEKTFGFMGVHLKLIVSVKFEGRVEKIPFFAKLIPTSASHRSFVIDLDFFKKEVMTYNTLIPKLSSCLPSGASFPVPRCFFTRGLEDGPGQKTVPGSEGKEIIILEDMTHRGYRTMENFLPLDVPHCHVVLKTLARFHASSILLEESFRKSHPKDFDPERDLFWGVKENFMVHQKGHMGYEWARVKAESLATASFKMWPERFRGVSRDEVMETLMKGWTRVFQMVKASPEYPNVLCHGDVWTNNTMFSYERDAEGNEVPVDAVFVDLQLVRYAPPILDILLFIHVCTKRDFRERHLEGFLKFYHESLKEYVSVEFLEEFMPFGQLLEMCDRYRDFGRLMGMGYLPFLLIENDEIISARERPSDGLDLYEEMMKDRGDQIVEYCKQSDNYRDWVTVSFEECLKELGVWR